MTLPAELLSQHLAIVGKTGSGKTYTAKGLVERMLRDKRRVCIIDPTGVWWGLKSSTDGKKPAFPVAVFGGEHADVPIAEHSGAALAKVLASTNLPAIVDLSEMLIGQRHRFVTDFAEALYRDNRMPLQLVIDEADEFCPQNPMPESKRMLHHIDRIVRRGRVRGFRVVLITQRPAVLHKNVLTQANTLIAMRLTAPQDRKAILSWVEGQADAAQGKAVLDSLARLQRGEGWVWAPEIGLLERQSFPKIATFDSSRAPEDGEAISEPTSLAAVDIAEIKAQFAEVAQEAQTLASLKQQVKELRQQLARVAAGGVPEAEVQRRIREAVAAVPRSTQTNPADRKVLGKIAQLVAPYAGVEITAIGLGAAVAPAVRQQHARAPAAAAAPGPVADGISASQQRILDVLAGLELFGVAAPHKNMIAAHAGASPTSGGYFNNLGRLRAQGLIDYPGAGTAALTDAGRTVANFPDKAPRLQDLHGAWLRLLSGSQQAILEVLLHVYPDAIGKDELADRVGASRTSGGYFNNLGHLRTLGAIEYPQKGVARASDLLFPKGKP